MSTKVNNRSFPLHSTHCATCLSSDRKLVLIKDVRYVVLFVKLFQLRLDITKHYVCWECKAFFFRMSVFRKQVRIAQKELSEWHGRNVLPNILRANKLKSLSTLSVMKPETFDKVWNNPEDDIETAMSEMFDDKKKLHKRKETLSEVRSGSEMTGKVKVEDSMSEENDQMSNLTNDTADSNDQLLSVLNDDTVEKDQTILPDLDDKTAATRSEADKTNVNNNDEDYEVIFVEEDMDECNEINDDDDFEVDYIEDWDTIQGHGEKEAPVDDTEYSLLIVKKQDDDDEDEPNSGSELDEPEFLEGPCFELSKDETNFRVTHMTLNELHVARHEDTLADMYLRYKFKCRTCITGYHTEAKLAHHLRLRHDIMYKGKKRRYKCSICETRFPQKSSLKAHYERHFRRYTCEKCIFSHHKLNIMFLHMVKEHDQGPTYTCRVCKLQFRRQHQLQWHTRTQHANVMPACDVCGKSFGSRSNLKTHMRVHAPPNNVQCPDCGRWVRKSSLDVHRAQHGVQVKPYCRKCDKHFTTQGSYKKHLLRSKRHAKKSNKSDSKITDSENSS